LVFGLGPKLKEILRVFRAFAGPVKKRFSRFFSEKKPK